jgi:hypothetical protein
MVETRRKNRRRSRSEVTEDAPSASNETTEQQPQEDVAAASDKHGEKETATGATKGKRKSVAITDAPQQTSETKKNQLANPTKNITTTADDSDLPTTNALSKLIPGYRAPLKLSCPSLDMFRPAGGLEALRRQAVRTDPSTAPLVAGTKDHQKHTKVMLQKSTHGGLPGSYAAAYSSFKKGTKPLAKTDAGSKWFGMAPTPVTDELKRDLALIRNRNYLDPKRFYKSSDAVGKVVQLGTVIEGAAEFYSSRLSKKQRKSNLTEEIMADPAVATYAQGKFNKMQREKAQKADKWKKARRPRVVKKR